MYVISQPLREMTSAKTDSAQDPASALDVAFCDTLTVQIRLQGRGADGAKVVLQHGSSREESAFMDLEGGEFPLDNTAASDHACKVFSHTLRFLRCRTTGLRDSEITFCIDLMGRGPS